MKYIYKKVKIAVPHCPKCGEELEGNGSQMTPYRCSCGVWLPDWFTGEYSIVPAKKFESEQPRKEQG